LHQPKSSAFLTSSTPVYCLAQAIAKFRELAYLRPNRLGSRLMKSEKSYGCVKEAIARAATLSALLSDTCGRSKSIHGRPLCKLAYLHRMSLNPKPSNRVKGSQRKETATRDRNIFFLQM